MHISIYRPLWKLELECMEIGGRFLFSWTQPYSFHVRMYSICKVCTGRSNFPAFSILFTRKPEPLTRKKKMSYPDPLLFSNDVQWSEMRARYVCRPSLNLKTKKPPWNLHLHWEKCTFLSASWARLWFMRCEGSAEELSIMLGEISGHRSLQELGIVLNSFFWLILDLLPNSPATLVRIELNRTRRKYSLSSRAHSLTITYWFELPAVFWEQPFSAMLMRVCFEKNIFKQDYEVHTCVGV